MPLLAVRRGGLSSVRKALPVGSLRILPFSKALAQRQRHVQPQRHIGTAFAATQKRHFSFLFPGEFKPPRTLEDNEEIHADSNENLEHPEHYIADHAFAHPRGNPDPYYKNEDHDNFPQEMMWRPDTWWAPEEPGIFSQYGVYPVAVFSVAMLFSKELFIIDQEFWEAVGANVCLFSIMGVAATFLHRGAVDRHQDLIDNTWLSMTKVKYALNNSVADFESRLNSIAIQKAHTKYLEAMDFTRSAFYALRKKQEFAARFETKLRQIESEEARYELELRQATAKRCIEWIKNRIETDEDLRRKILESNFNNLEKVIQGEEVFDTTVQELYGAFVGEYSDEIESKADVPQPVGDAEKNLLTGIHNVVKELEVSDASVGVPDEIEPRKLGFFGDLSPEQAASIPSSDSLKPRQIEIVQKQKEKFQPDKVPKSLQDLEAHLSS